MFLGGLWHGASWKFAVWGAMHGFFLAAHKWMMGRGAPVPQASRLPDSKLAGGTPAVRVLKGLATFHLVALTWIFFASDTFAQAYVFLKDLFIWRAPNPSEFASGTFAQTYEFLKRLIIGYAPNPSDAVAFNKDDVSAALAGLAVMIFLIDVPQFVTKDHHAMLRWPFAWRVLGFLILVLGAILCRGAEHVPFIYFKF